MAEVTVKVNLQGNEEALGKLRELETKLNEVKALAQEINKIVGEITLSVKGEHGE